MLPKKDSRNLIYITLHNPKFSAARESCYQVSIINEVLVTMLENRSGTYDPPTEGLNGNSIPTYNFSNFWPLLNKKNLRTALEVAQKGKKIIWSFLCSNKELFSYIPPFYFVAILILSAKSSIQVFCQSPNLETAKPGCLTRLEKQILLSSMWLEKLGKFLVELYVPSVSIFYFTDMCW